MTEQKLLDLAAACGFEHAGPLNVSALRIDPRVRDMCSADLCRSYGRSWTCPPHCGTLEEISEKAAHYSRGILLQSTGHLEDDFDVDTMLETEKLHKRRFKEFTAKVREVYPDCLPMGAGACGQCGTCTCPDEPCRFPELAIPSMEAYGLMVSQVCLDSDIPYYYGKGTLTYTSCVLTE